jgi:hypothetical protein
MLVSLLAFYRFPGAARGAQQFGENGYRAGVFDTLCQALP